MGFQRRMVQRIGRLGLDMVPDDVKESARRKLAVSIKAELVPQLTAELTQLKAELKAVLKVELVQVLGLVLDLPRRVEAFCAAVDTVETAKSPNVDVHAQELRRLVRSSARLSEDAPENGSADDLLAEIAFLHANAHTLKPAFDALRARRVLYCGQMYYYPWYLSRALRTLGWKADVYNWDGNPATQIYYHGEDFRLGGDIPSTLEGELGFYVAALYQYDLIHFSNMLGISFGWRTEAAVGQVVGKRAEIYLLKALGKKIVYTNNGCHDGVSQTTFSQWGPEPVCSICRWQHEPSVCSDERNLAWGKFRNSVADYQCTLGGNRVDYNDDPRVHEAPECCCLDPELWHPEIEIPEQYVLPQLPAGAVRLYHAVGHRDERTRSDGVNIKSSHVYLPLIERLRAEGMVLELIEPTGIPNKEVRFLQAQADIFLDMLTYGWFGANIREAMMLAKPVICFIRPEWLESVREEIPEYADELPIISATPQTLESVLRDLIDHPEKRH